MAKSSRSLLDEIESGALDPSVGLPTVLRKVISLGGATGSESLREWATRELKGYEDQDEIPEYRRVQGPLVLDGGTYGARITGQQVPHNMIPDFARERMRGPTPLGGPIAEVVQLVESARARGEAVVNFQPPGSVELTALINASLAEAERRDRLIDLPPSQVVERIYWQVSTTTLEGVLDVVRTTLVELVAEMRAGTVSDELPSRDVAEQAVQVAVHGEGHRVVVQVGNTGTTVGGGELGQIHADKAETRGRRLTYWLVALATVVAAVAGVWALFIR